MKLVRGRYWLNVTQSLEDEARRMLQGIPAIGPIAKILPNRVGTWIGAVIPELFGHQDLHLCGETTRVRAHFPAKTRRPQELR